jgi:hypothetical protein
MRYAVLRGTEVVVTDDVVEWAKSFEKKSRILAKTQVGEIEVSTVFLGIDHGFGGRQLWFETMTFGDDEERQQRYATWAEAESGHIEMVESLGGHTEPNTFLKDLANL